MAGTFLQLILIVCVLLVAWFVTERFSPDPLITKIVQIIIFLVALYLIIMKLLPMAGVSF